MRKINNKLPTLVNLNEDPQLSEVLIYILREGMRSDAGRSSSNASNKSRHVFFSEATPRLAVRRTRMCS